MFYKTFLIDDKMRKNLITLPSGKDEESLYITFSKFHMAFKLNSYIASRTEKGEVIIQGYPTYT